MKIQHCDLFASSVEIIKGVITALTLVSLLTSQFPQHFIIDITAGSYTCMPSLFLGPSLLLHPSLSSTFTHTKTGKCTGRCRDTYIHVCRGTSTYTDVCTHMHSHTHALTYTDIHGSSYTHTYIHYNIYALLTGVDSVELLDERGGHTVPKGVLMHSCQNACLPVLCAGHRTVSDTCHRLSCSQAPWTRNC